MSNSINMVGKSVRVDKQIEESDVENFANLSLDKNPIHFNKEYARNTIFGKRIAHGMVGAALISGALTRLMGDGNIWLSVSLVFKKPIYIGDTVSCTLEIKEIDRRKVATINVCILNQNSEVVIDGSLMSMVASTIQS